MAAVPFPIPVWVIQQILSEMRRESRPRHRPLPVGPPSQETASGGDGGTDPLQAGESLVDCHAHHQDWSGRTLSTLQRSSTHLDSAPTSFLPLPEPCLEWVTPCVLGRFHANQAGLTQVSKAMVVQLSSALSAGTFHLSTTPQLDGTLMMVLLD